MKSIVNWFENEKGYGFIRYKGKVVSIHYCIYGEKSNDNVVKDKHVEIELVKAGKNYNLIKLEQREEVA